MTKKTEKSIIFTDEGRAILKELWDELARVELDSYNIFKRNCTEDYLLEGIILDGTSDSYMRVAKFLYGHIDEDEAAKLGITLGNKIMSVAERLVCEVSKSSETQIYIVKYPEGGDIDFCPVRIPSGLEENSIYPILVSPGINCILHEDAKGEITVVGGLRTEYNLIHDETLKVTLQPVGPTLDEVARRVFDKLREKTHGTQEPKLPAPNPYLISQ